MIEARPFSSLGQFRNTWLNARHHFSFGHYHDPARLHWGALRVWNDDEIAPGTGFDPHGHADMEIITYVRDGAITHKDSLGHVGRTEAGDVQVMSAGAGITHAEYNLESETTRIFQIWIVPETRGGPPAWGARRFPKDDRSGRFVVLASGFPGDEGALPIRQKARVLGATLKAGERLDYAPEAGRHLYAAVARGAVSLNGLALGARDAAAARDEAVLAFEAGQDSEIVLVDAP